MPRFHIDPEWRKNATEEEIAEALDALEAFEAHIKLNPLLNFEPHFKQKIFLSSFNPIKLFLGGNRSGKTTASVVDDIIQALNRDWVPEHLLPYKKWEPPFYCRIVTPDLGNTMELVHDKIRDLIPRSQLSGGEWSKAYDKQLRKLHLDNGSWFQFLSSDQDRDKHGGDALHRVHFDEEPPKHIYNENTARLIDYDGDQIFSMTPLEGMTWMYEEFYEPWERGHSHEITVVLVDMDDNPHLSEHGKALALRGYSAEERLARKSGRFVSFSGMIYPEFDRAIHVIPQRDPDPNSTIYVGIDPGLRGMAAVVYCEVDEEGTMTVFHEIGLQGTEATAQNVCRLIHLANMRWGLQPRMYVIDPAAQNRMHQTGRSDQDEYRTQGIYTVLGQNSVRPGINNVKTRLRPIDPLLGTPLAPKLYVTENCSILQDEFRKYRWVRQGRAEGDPKEEPVKKDDHLLDALRYVCMARPWAPEVNAPPKNETLQERLIREDIRRTSSRRKATNHPSGPGVFA